MKHRLHNISVGNAVLRRRKERVSRGGVSGSHSCYLVLCACITLKIKIKKEEQKEDSKNNNNHHHHYMHKNKHVGP
jgi:hypothetical protein